MKKIILLLLLALPVLGFARDRDAQLHKLVSSYKGRPGFEVVDLRGPVLGLAKLAVRVSADDRDARQAMKAFNSLKRITIVDYEDSAPTAREAFARRVNSLLSDDELLLEAVDDDGRVRIYDILSADGETVRDVVLHEEGDGALICFSGTIRADRLGELIGND